MEEYKEKTIESYDKYAKEHSEKFKELMDIERRGEFKKFIKLLPGKKVLDLGCGSGDHSLYFSQQGMDVVCIDLSEGMIKLCKEKGLKAFVMDIEELEFEDNSFDGIWAVTSLLHVPKSKIQDVIKKLNQILTNNGILFVCVKEGEGERLVDDKYEGDTKRFFVFWEEEEFLNEFKEYFELIETWKVELRKSTFLHVLFKKK
ncbi:class I SAM-dependent methyltransferase [Candidatus Woesearchaeota archaeon]|nr:class I SAM-dependent methyltransferase [Candidatus Woesearchaeota archaeon]